MLALDHWPAEARHNIVGLFTDIDDTLTTDGAITPDALAALHELRTAGLTVIAITGRPAGWSEPFAFGDAERGIAPWPVHAIVAENGAVAFFSGKKSLYRSPSGRFKLSKLYQQDAATRAANALRLTACAARIQRELPGAQLARDSAGRETDIAIDHSEFTLLPPEQIKQVVAIMRAEGMNASVSSIHINGWFGAHDKLSGARWIMRELLGRDLDAEIDRWAFVGDSTNDQAMFRAFTHGIGVANIRRFEAELTDPPRYVTEGERGAGFAQVAHMICKARRCPATP
ncbi:MAG: HAD-IIB family hydrolase [Burkholderiales bacterium]